MLMSNLQDLLVAEMDALQEKMYKCKTIHLRYSMRGDHKEFLLKQSILGVYAEWEGFFKKALSLYLQEINKEEHSFGVLHENYVSYQTDQMVGFKNPKTNFGVIKKIARELYEMYQCTVVFSTKIDTGSNANLKIVNSSLEKLRLRLLDEAYDKPLNKLIRYRNSIAHGDEGIPVYQEDVDHFTLHIQEMASDLLVSIVDGYRDQVYLSDSARSAGVGGSQFEMHQ